MDNFPWTSVGLLLLALGTIAHGICIKELIDRVNRLEIDAEYVCEKIEILEG